MARYYEEVTEPWYKPKYWRKRTWAIVVASIVAVVVIVIVVPVVVTKKEKYPDYSRLNYTLTDSYSGESFFDKFDYFNDYDPAHGFVHYVPRETATKMNLTYASASSAVLKVDTTVGPSSEPNASTGRFSVRVESKKQYNKGLFLFDVKHTPFGCGTWPALWLADPAPDNWPKNGEIDVMEAANQGTDGNSAALHTSSGCDMSVKRKMSGKAGQKDCNVATNDNTGCVVTASGGKGSYGAALNDAGGGVMALEWRDAGIRIWQFQRGSIPADIADGDGGGGMPDPSSWGTAMADFPSTDCDIGNHFKNQSIIVNIDLCGDMIAATYNDSGCPSTCTDFVANEPSAFHDAFWEFGDFKVYTAA